MKKWQEIFTKEIGRRLSLQQHVFLCRQLSFAMNGGMSLPDAIGLAGGEQAQRICRQFLEELRMGIQQGKSLSQSLQQSTVQYSPVLTEFVLAGEQNGRLGEAMEQASEYFQQQQRIRQMLLSAMFYPCVLLVLMLVAFSAMFLLVAPTVVQTYQNFDAELPVMTQMILAVSNWLQNRWPVLLLAIVAIAAGSVMAARKVLKKSENRDRVKNRLLKVPILGRLYRQYWFVQIAQAMGLMLSGGMLLVPCLQAVQGIYARSFFALELQELAGQVTDGHSLGECMERCTFMPQMAKQMLAVSEQTGALPQALVQLSSYYQQQFQQRVQTLIGLLEPCFVVLLGLSILVLAGSLFLPLVQSYQYLF